MTPVSTVYFFQVFPDTCLSTKPERKDEQLGGLPVDCPGRDTYLGPGMYNLQEYKPRDHEGDNIRKCSRVSFCIYWKSVDYVTWSKFCNTSKSQWKVRLTKIVPRVNY